jgi:hypothetical protein
VVTKRQHSTGATKMEDGVPDSARCHGERQACARLEAALAATGRDDLKHGTNAACVHDCVCSECREHQRIRMARQI